MKWRLKEKSFISLFQESAGNSSTLPSCPVLSLPHSAGVVLLKENSIIQADLLV